MQSATDRRERWEKSQNAFAKVTTQYAHTTSLSFMAAVNPDDDVEPNRTLGPGSLALHFRCDLEKITERVLKDKPELQAAWFSLVAGEQIAPNLAKRVIESCGLAYLRTGMTNYFAPTIRRGRVQQVLA